MSAPCLCGCGIPAREGSKYASSPCRTRYFDSMHPRLDLSGLEMEARKRAERLAGEAVRAAKEGCERSTIDARHPVKHERDTRPSCRVRLDQYTWDGLALLAEEMGLTEGPDGQEIEPNRSAVVRSLVRQACDRIPVGMSDTTPTREQLLEGVARLLARGLFLVARDACGAEGPDIEAFLEGAGLLEWVDFDQTEHGDIDFGDIEPEQGDRVWILTGLGRALCLKEEA